MTVFWGVTPHILAEFVSEELTASIITALMVEEYTPPKCQVSFYTCTWYNLLLATLINRNVINISGVKSP